MGLAKAALSGAAHGLGAAGKGAFMLGTRPNLAPLGGGGATAAIITRQVNMGGYLAIGAVGNLVSGAKGIMEASNRRKLGPITYQDGMTRMTNSFTTGAVPAMMNASKGNYGAFAGMAKNVVKSPGIGVIDDFGANSAMISALYNMGGR